MCNRCSAARQAANAAAAAQSQADELASTPLATPELLRKIIQGGGGTPALRWDGVQITGKECADLIREANVTTSPLGTGEYQTVRKGFSKDVVEVYAPGWHLDGTGTSYPNEAETYLLADGRQLIRSGFSEGGPRGWRYNTTIKQPGELIEPHALRMGITFKLFGSRFAHIKNLGDTSSTSARTRAVEAFKASQRRH